MSASPQRSYRPVYGLAALLAAQGTLDAQFGNEWTEFRRDPTRLSAGMISDIDHEVDFASGDLDKNGFDDLVVVRKEPFTTPGKRTNLLLMNLDGTLTDQTALYASASDVEDDDGFLTPTNDRDVVIVDVDLDGWLDVVTATTFSDGDEKALGHPRIYMNLGEDEGTGDWLGLKYEESRFPQLIQYDSGLPENPRFCAVAAGDVTGDGYPDLYFGDYDSGVTMVTPPEKDLNDRLLVNDGAGYFVDESTTRMTDLMLLSNFSTSVAIADINGDGATDVLKHSALGPYYVAVCYNNPANEGNFIIFDPFHESGNSYFFDVGDLNNDGRLDVVVTQDSVDRYRYNLGNDPLGRVIWGPEKIYTFLDGADDGFGEDAIIADLNADGWNDVVVCDVDADVPGYNRRIHIYHNPGGAIGEEITLVEEREQLGTSGWLGAPGLFLDDLTAGHDVAVMDVDDDGINDMVVGRMEGTDVWMNQIDICQPDLGFGGPGTATLSVCGDGLTPHGSAQVLLEGAPPFTGALVFYGTVEGALPLSGGTLVPFPFLGIEIMATDSNGEISIPAGAALGPLDLYLQVLYADGTLPFGMGFSNAVRLEYVP